MPKKKRAEWSEKNLKEALIAIRNGLSISKASQTFHIPRTTLGLHSRKNDARKRLGRRSILTENQENDLVNRIHRLAEVGLPVTPNVVRRSVFSYAMARNIPNPFSQTSKLAGRKWLKLFFKRHPEVVRRKAQQMNPARAQKMNPFIVNDYFNKLKEIYTKLELFDKPGNVYNMDEKGCRLTIHKQQNVLAKKGAKRVHLVAPEHGENVTIVACGNALGQAIPAMILFKGKRCKPEWGDHLPPGSKITMTIKGSMTSEAFISWLDHFAMFKNPGPTLLIFDGAKSHLDASIVDAAENHGITLFCLPSNTTHELQPMDKAVFRSYEAFWDQEVLNFLTTQPGKALTKIRFGEIFSKVWLKAMTPSNILSGFRSTGIHPFAPDAIPESAFAPSIVTRIDENKNESIMTEPTSPIPGPSGVNSSKNNEDTAYLESDSSSDSEYSLHDDSYTESDNEPLIKLISASTGNITEEEVPRDDLNTSFKDMGFLVTPEIKVASSQRKPAINSRAQEVTRDLFSPRPKVVQTKSIPKKALQAKSAPKKSSVEVESWFCFLCKLESQIDMRLCSLCNRYVHEECVGLTKTDKETFICPDCET